jgi:hypothetical protein
LSSNPSRTSPQPRGRRKANATLRSGKDQLVIEAAVGPLEKRDVYDGERCQRSYNAADHAASDPANEYETNNTAGHERCRHDDQSREFRQKRILGGGITRPTVIGSMMLAGVRAVRRLVAAIRLAGAWRPKFSFRIAIHLLLAEIPIAERERGRTAGRPTAGSLFFEFTAANP